MLVKTLSKKMPLSELYALDQTNPGTLTTFWRHYHGSQANFCTWLTSMEKRDPNWEEYIANWRATQEDKPTKPLPSVNPVKEEVEDNMIEDNELSIQDRIVLIREKYGNNDD